MNLTLKTYLAIDKMMPVKFEFSELMKIVDRFNDGSDDDFIISYESVEYYNLGVNDFKEIGEFEDGETAYLDFENFHRFCEYVEDGDFDEEDE